MKKLIPAMLLVLVVFLTAGTCKPPPPPLPPEVIIPDTTKVTDSATRDALTDYDLDSGVMRFSRTTAVLQNLKPDDVIVSEPSAAAPFGYLRKVKVIRQEGDELVLETTQANLTDAIHKGGFEEDGDFTADDLMATALHVPGVSVLPAPAALSTQAGVGENYRFRLGFDEVALDLGEGDVKVKVKLNGELFFNAGWGVHLNIDKCLAFPPVCVESFEAKVGIEEWLKVTVSGEANALLKKEIKIASYYFKPIWFFIGPVPVVINPSIEVFVGGSGEVRLSFQYGITQKATALVGARWTPKQGWKDITDFGVSLVGYDDFKFNATMNAKAYTKALTNLKLYDTAGVALGLELSAELDGAIPRNPTWIARAGIEGYIAFVVGLPVIGTLKEYKATLFKESIELARAANQAPVFSNVTAGTTRVDLGKSVYVGRHSGFVRGYFDVMDPEGDPFTLSYVSNRDGNMNLSNNQYTFRTPGLRTVTVTARDNQGKSSSITLRFDVVNSPPVITTTVGSDQVPQTVEYFISARAFDPNDGYLTCDRLSWTVSGSDTIRSVASGGGCAAIAVFNTQGSRTLSVRATDALGATATKSLNVFVGPPPPNPPPVITSFSVSAKLIPGAIDPYCKGIFCQCPVSISGICEVWDGALLKRSSNALGGLDYDFEPPLYLKVGASDPNGDSLTITWTCEVAGQQAAVTDLGNDVFSCDPSSVAPTEGGMGYVKVVVSDGSTPINRVRAFEVGPAGPR